MPVIQITMSQGRSVEQKRELVKVLTKETARIMKTDEETAFNSAMFHRPAAFLDNDFLNSRLLL